MSNKVALITGITGHSGKYFLKELIKNNYVTKIRVVIRGNDSFDYLEKSGLNIEILKGDFPKTHKAKNTPCALLTAVSPPRCPCCALKALCASALRPTPI